MKNNVSTMLKCSMLIAISVILGKIFALKMPYGGSINLSPIPIIISSFMFGLSWGVYTGFTYSIVKIILGFRTPPITNLLSTIAVFFLDYVIPYTSLGFSSIFKVKGKTAVYLGIISVMIIRLLSTTISGIIIWGNLLWPDLNIIAYSLIYNSIYILPETILSLAICPIILKFTKHKI
jgi:thiamine transporter